MRVLALVAALTIAGCSEDSGTNPQPIPPTARIRVVPPYGRIGTEFTFDASRSRDGEDSLGVLEVRWDWGGDGEWDTEFSLEKTALHRFDEAGTFPVLLEVRDSSGLTATTRTFVHLFLPTECTASAEPVAGTAPLEVAFDVVATGGHGIFYFFWAFGEGDTLAVDTPTRIFEAPGTYEVVLRVVDPVYVQPDCFDTLRIEVAAPPASAWPADGSARTAERAVTPLAR